MSDLNIYLRETESTFSELATVLGISQPYLSQLSSLQRPLSLELAYGIEVATDGAIPMKYWIKAREALESTADTSGTNRSEKE